jgi:hypothetical protein
MKTAQSQWTAEGGWPEGAPQELDDAQIVLVFGGTSALKQRERVAEIRAAYPGAHLLGCSTAGEICDVSVADESIVTTAIRFDRARVEAHRVSLSETAGSFETGEALAKALEKDGLAHVFVISDGLNVNGSELVAGLTANLPEGVTITGGLSGDGDRFEETFVLAGGDPEQEVVAALGLYGDVTVGFASLGGWDPFGPERLVTRSSGNVVYELDGRSALALYKEYLGEHAEGLPATGLLFPLTVRVRDDDTPVVRTILAVDEDDQSLTFAGDVPEGSYARLMMANFDRLVDGAAGAARTSIQAVGDRAPDLAVLISCVGRKMVLRQRVEEEVEAVRAIFGDDTVLTGFYSYGEISPFTPNARCELHNQTMTITAIYEGDRAA